MRCVGWAVPTKRLDALWRYDQYIANADGHPDAQAFWRDMKSQEKSCIDRLKVLLAREIQQGGF